TVLPRPPDRRDVAATHPEQRLQLGKFEVVGVRCLTGLNLQPELPRPASVRLDRAWGQFPQGSSHVLLHSKKGRVVHFFLFSILVIENRGVEGSGESSVGLERAPSVPRRTHRQS